MTNTDIVYNFLRQNYADSEPIFLSDIDIPGIKAPYIRQIIKKLTSDGRIKRYDTGIYYFSGKSLFRSGNTPSIEEIIKKKYLMNGSEQCGYLSGIQFANQIGITSQVSAVYEVYTNKATTAYREKKLAGFRILVKKPYVPIDSNNSDTLQFLDLLKEVTDISELEGSALKDRILGYMRKKGIRFDLMKKYLPYYPERIYKNMYEAGVLDGVSA